MDSCNAEELARWRNINHRFPPYQYKDENTIYDSRKRRRIVADTLLRETLLPFREDHAHAGVTRAERTKGPMVEKDLRYSWIGNSMHCKVGAALLRPFFEATYHGCSLPSVQELINMKPAKRVNNMSEEMRLARAHCTYQSHRGGEIRNEQGPEPSVEKFGFHPVQGNQWLWKAAISCKLHLNIYHISALECRALPLALG